MVLAYLASRVLLAVQYGICRSKHPLTATVCLPGRRMARAQSGSPDQEFLAVDRRPPDVRCIGHNGSSHPTPHHGSSYRKGKPLTYLLNRSGSQPRC